MATDESNNQSETADDKSAAEQTTKAETDQKPVDETAPAAATTPTAGTAATAGTGEKGLKKWWHSYTAHKKRNIPLTILAVLVLIMLIPATRYKVLGLFMKRSFTVSVVDSTTNEPVSAASVSLAGKTATTDKDGKASLTVNVGNSTVSITKKYYQDFHQKVLVSTSSSSNNLSAKIVATGRQVPVVVNNKITGVGVANVTIKAADTEAQTDKDGKATIVLPPDSTTQAATLTSIGYNSAKVTIQVTDQASDKNTFGITPSGTVYFLSKASGKIDVVKTNLDGSERKTVLAGTGKEDDTGTVLLSTRDWKYLVLKARRDSTLAKLYLIDTSNDKVLTIDEGDASFDLIGWYDNQFVYVVNRNKVHSWQSGQASIKSYNPTSNKITILDSTSASGSSDNDAKFESYYTANIHFLGDQLFYTKNWSASNYYDDLAGKKNVLISVSTNGSNKKTITSLDANSSSFSQIVQYSPVVAYVDVSYTNGSKDSYYKLNSSGQYTKDSSLDSEDINKLYPTYLISPSDKSTLWADSRDGKYTLFVGNDVGANGKQIASLSPYNVYGWFTENYVLVSKDSSELYIMPRAGGKAFKISDYHKPNQNYYGYGGGYGGI